MLVTPDCLDRGLADNLKQHATSKIYPGTELDQINELIVSPDEETKICLKM